MNRDILSWLTFLTVLSLIVLSVNVYIGFRITGAFPAGSPWRWIFWCLVLGLSAIVLLSPIFRIFHITLPDSLERKIFFVGYTYLGFMATMVFALLCFDFLFFLGDFILDLNAVSQTSLAAEIINPARRALIFKYSPWLAVGLTGMLTYRGYREASRGPRVVKIDISKKGLRPELQGLKIAQISDLHVSGTIKKDYVEDVVAKTMALKPDIIVLTGDLVDGTYPELKNDVDPLRKLQAPMGVYYITGNHEYYSGHEDWEKVFASFNFKVLHNGRYELQKNGAKFVVAGVPDFTYESFGLGKVDANKAFEGMTAADFVLFLVHQPKGYKLIENLPADLQLSGHTHAGQFFPVSLFITFFHKYAKGLYRHEDKFWVYVNPGTGYWGPINRLGVPSEITLLTLRT